MYHYTESGMRDVWLANGYERRETSYGKSVAIRDVPGLHRAICRRLIATRPKWRNSSSSRGRRECGGCGISSGGH